MFTRSVMEARSFFDGASWTLMSTPDDLLYGVWGSGPDDIFAVGEAGLVLRRNQTAWSVMQTPPTRPSNLRAVGDMGTLVHYDGIAVDPGRAHARFDGRLEVHQWRRQGCLRGRHQGRCLASQRSLRASARDEVILREAARVPIDERVVDPVRDRRRLFGSKRTCAAAQDRVRGRAELAHGLAVHGRQ